MSTNENSSHVVPLAEKYGYEGVKQSHSEHYLRKYQAREKPGFTRLKGRERPEGNEHCRMLDFVWSYFGAHNVYYVK